MKTCPFCAEDIKDAAIKCKHCGSMLSTAQPPVSQRGGDGASQGSSQRQAASSVVAPPATGAPPAPAGGHRSLQSELSGSARRILYSGVPSWRAFFAEYAAIVLLGVITPLLAQGAVRWMDATTFTVALSVIVPIVIAVIAYFIVGLYRRSRVVRISTTNIETESGILSKKIDVLELWRCRDVRYKQSLFDRIVGIAHIEIYTTDVTTPQLEVVGLPASRQLFEKIRDSIEIQRHSRNVVGFVQ